jgi:hypothetical protein
LTAADNSPSPDDWNTVPITAMLQPADVVCRTGTECSSG